MEKVNVIGDFSHIIVAVRDLEKAQRFFSELFNAEFGKVNEYQGLGIRAVMSDYGLEIVCPTREDSDVARFVNKRGEGVYAVVFRTADARQARAKVEKMGIRVTADVSPVDMVGHETAQQGTREIWLHPKDTFGMCTLLVQFNR